jgi:DNA-directed RNA polymerase specialized sigma24 family protein
MRFEAPAPSQRRVATGRARPARGLPHGLELYNYRQDVARYVSGLGIPTRMVEELTHDVFVVAYSGVEKFRGQSSVKTWLRGIALHLVLNWRRRRGNHERCDEACFDVSNDQCVGYCATSTTALNAAVFKQLCERVNCLLEAQPATASRLWEMVVLEEVPLTAAAKVLQLTPSEAHSMFAKTNRLVQKGVRGRDSSVCSPLRPSRRA